MAHVIDQTYGRNRDLGDVTDRVLLAYYAGIGYTIDGVVTTVVTGPAPRVVAGVIPPYGASDGDVLIVDSGQIVAAPLDGGVF